MEMVKIITIALSVVFLGSLAHGRAANPQWTLRQEMDAILAEHGFYRQSQRSWRDPARGLVGRHESEILPRLGVRGSAPIGGSRGVLDVMILAALSERHEDAAEILKDDVLHQRHLNIPSLNAITFMPEELAQRIIDEIAPQLRRAIPMVRLLAAIGDQEALELVRERAQEEPLDGRVKGALLDAADRIERRLAMPEPHRSERVREELVFWQTLHDSPNMRHPGGNYSMQARWLEQDGIRLSAEFLIERLNEREPEPVIHAAWPNPWMLAIAIVAQQKEEAAISVLKAIACEEGERAGPAKSALRMIGTEEALRALASVSDDERPSLLRQSE